MKRFVFLGLLIAALLFQAVGAVYGGLALAIGPDGSILQIPVSWLQHSPFKSFLIPGLILCILLGLLPLVVAFGLVLKPNWKALEMLNIYPRRHWSLTYALYFGIMLVCWILIQLALVQQYFWLQPVMGLIGVLIIILSLTPTLITNYEK